MKTLILVLCNVLLSSSVCVRLSGQTQKVESFGSIFTRGSIKSFDRRLHEQTVPFRNGTMQDWQDESVDRMVRNAGIRSLGDSAREYGESLPIWKMMDEHLGSFFANSIGAVEEDHIDPLNPSFQLSERLWWSRFRKNGDLRYGLRPFRSSPYGFLGSKWTEKGETIFYSHLRCYLEDFDDPKFELIVGVPVTRALSLTIGGSYTISNSYKEPYIASLRLQRSVSANYYNFWYVGLETGQYKMFPTQQSRIVFGLSYSF